MKTFGPIYVDKIKYPHRNFLPITEIGWTQETEEPFRDGKCLVFRFPFTHPGFVLGVFGKPQDEEHALVRAIQAKELDVDLSEIDTWRF
jgi:hypothetical protein